MVFDRFTYYTEYKLLNYIKHLFIFSFSALSLICMYYLRSHRSTYIHRSKALSSQFSSQLSFLLKLFFNTLDTWCKELTHLKRPWCWERLKWGGEGDDRGWDGWMASLTQWTWVWVNSGSWRWTGSPGVLQSMGLQRVGHEWATELNWVICWGIFGLFPVFIFLNLWINVL